MSSIRQKQAAMHKKQLKEEEERRINGNKPIINANANLDIDKIAKEADKQADEILAKVVEESKPKEKRDEPQRKAVDYWSCVFAHFHHFHWTVGATPTVLQRIGTVRGTTDSRT